MWIVNGEAHLKFSIPHSKQFLSFSPIGWFLLSLCPTGHHLHFSLQIQIANDKPTTYKLSTL
jgi:hypothetical protein